MSYASLADLKSALRLVDTNDDALLQVALDAATLAIDQHCGRIFTPSAGVVSTRAYPLGKTTFIDDIYDASGLIVTIWGTAIPAAVPNVSPGYVLTPETAPGRKEPYTGLYYYGLPYGTSYPWLYPYQIIPGPVPGLERANVHVSSGYWGFAATIPPTVNMACLLQASRWFARRNSPYGIAGSPDMGSELRLLAKLDADVAVMLAGLVRFF